MPTNPDRILLDTNAVIFMQEGIPMHAGAVRMMQAMPARGVLLVSPITAWEIGLLVRKKRIGYAGMVMDPSDWFATLLMNPAVSLAPFTHEIAFHSCNLPGELHDDPMDRLLVATARHLKVPLMTRDAKIIAYAQAGHLEVIPC